MKSLFDYIQIDYNSYIGTEIGNVMLIKELGRGNKGVVFTGFQQSLKRNVAVKLLPKVSVRNESEREMFQSEAEIIAGLSHPNIIPIFEMGETDELFYHIMHLVEGSDLDTIIQKRLKHPIPSKQLLSFQEIFDFMSQILDGLDYAHRDGVVHRDIKPANILVEERSKRPFIADFGIALTSQLISNHMAGMIMGSPVYLAPEQATSQNVDGRADIYAIGMTFIKMLLGDIPRRKESPETIIKRKIQNPDSFLLAVPSQLAHRIDNDLKKILIKAIASKPENRYKDCNEFRMDLNNYRNNHFNLFAQ